MIEDGTQLLVRVVKEAMAEVRAERRSAEGAVVAEGLHRQEASLERLLERATGTPERERRKRAVLQ